LTLVYYAANLGLFFCGYAILTLGLNIQFGFAGVLNFAYIAFWAIGAYITAVFLLGPSTAFSGETYILGLQLPFIVALLAGGVAAGMLAVAMGALILRRLRGDFIGIGLFALSFALYDLVGGYKPLFNGWDGIIGIPLPLNFLNLDPEQFIIFYLIPSGLLAAVLYWVAQRFSKSPYGRALRATREDEMVAASFGKNTYRLRLTAMVIGCIYAGLAGGLMIGFLGAMAPASWTNAETFIIWTALIVGGLGNNRGAILGVLVIIIVLGEGSRLLPLPIELQSLVPAVRGIVIGLVLIAVLYWRPKGLVPEKRPDYHLDARQSSAAKP
jgi:ABC-type branched-subunit amino acid transport system permease subunit